MKVDINIPFKGICTLVFQLEDGSVITATTTLNKEILKQYGVDELDGFVDLDLRKVIPEDLFEHLLVIVEGASHETSPLDTMFNLGGKVSW